MLCRDRASQLSERSDLQGPTAPGLPENAALHGSSVGQSQSPNLSMGGVLLPQKT